MVVGVATGLRPPVSRLCELCQVGKAGPAPVHSGEDSRMQLIRLGASSWETSTKVTGSPHFTRSLYGGYSC